MTEQLQTIKSDYKQLSDIEHTLLRAEIFAGPRTIDNTGKYLLHADGKIYYDNVHLSQATITFANELLCNSFDEAARATQANYNKPWAISLIDVVVDLRNKSLRVKDNGGIPIAIDASTNLCIPAMIFGHLRTGSNYTDERGDVGGQNGLGAKLCNIFSKHFHLFTADGVHSFQQSWHDNMTVAGEPTINNCKDHFTEIIAEFDTDFERTKIGKEAYSLDWARCIEMRCAEIAAMTSTWDKPLTVLFKCINEDGSEWFREFRFNSFNDYLKLWPNNERFIVDNQYKFNIALGLSAGAQESSAIINGLQCPWGTHIDTFADACVYHIRAHINARYKIDVKPAKIKSYFKFVSAWQINAPVFSGQTKEILVSDVKDFGMPVIPSEAFIKKLLRSDIMNTIVEELHNRINAQRKAELAQQQKDMERKVRKNLMPQKLTDAANAGTAKYSELYVVEGDSAATGLQKFRHADTQGVFALFGKSCGNMLYSDEFRVLSNKALSALCQGLGFNFTGIGRLRYDKIIITTDADHDGNAICGLLLTFFNKFMPELIEEGRLYRLSTPIMTAHHAKTGELRQYYSLDDFNRDRHLFRSKDWQVSYKKGLASLEDDDYVTIMNTPRLIQIVKDDLADSSLMDWFGNDPNRRKELMSMSELVDDNVFENLYTDDTSDNAEQEQATLF